MIQRPLMTPDELKSMPKGSFVVMKTGSHPMKTKLKLFFKWGIQFGEPLQMPDLGKRPVQYASREELEAAILKAYPLVKNKPGGAWSEPFPALLAEQETSGLITKKEGS